MFNTQLADIAEGEHKVDVVASIAAVSELYDVRARFHIIAEIIANSNELFHSNP